MAIGDRHLTIIVRGPRAKTLFSKLVMGYFKADWKYDRSTILAVNRRGKTRVLFYEDHAEEAGAKRQRVEDELRDLGLAAWCERYAVPMSFATGER